VFNLAAGGQTSLNELIDVLHEVIGCNTAPNYDPVRSGDIKFSKADISKAVERMGYTPEISFLEGISRTVDWYRNQQ
jgi:UDP-N-acetylglucosamine/UDP-N-acetylgalactosamine 4-epimerase